MRLLCGFWCLLELGKQNDVVKREKIGYLLMVERDGNQDQKCDGSQNKRE